MGVQHDRPRFRQSRRCRICIEFIRLTFSEFALETPYKIDMPFVFLSIVSFEQQLILLRLTSSELNPKTTVRFA